MEIHTTPVSRVYAEALFRTAKERDVVSEIDVGLRGLAAMMRENPDFQAFLAAPMIDATRKKVAVEKSMKGNVDDLIVDFLCLLIDKGRDVSLEGIAAQFRVLSDASVGRVRVHATSPEALSAEQRARLEEFLQQTLQSDCTLETQVKPEILGGMILRIGDKLYDGSVRRQLQQVGDQLMRSSGYED